MKEFEIAKRYLEDLKKYKKPEGSWHIVNRTCYEHMRACVRFLDFLETITYGCDRNLGQELQASCGDISFANKIMLCNSCIAHYDNIQNKITEIKQTIKLYNKDGIK